MRPSLPVPKARLELFLFLHLSKIWTLFHSNSLHLPPEIPTPTQTLSNSPQNKLSDPTQTLPTTHQNSLLSTNPPPQSPRPFSHEASLQFHLPPPSVSLLAPRTRNINPHKTIDNELSSSGHDRGRRGRRGLKLQRGRPQVPGERIHLPQVSPRGKFIFPFVPPLRPTLNPAELPTTASGTDLGFSSSSTRRSSRRSSALSPRRSPTAGAT